jgi:hypothetical protein
MSSWGAAVVTQDTRARRNLGQWLRDNWIEVLLLAILAIAFLWYFRIGRALLMEDRESTTVLPAAVPTLAVDEGVLTFSGQTALNYVAELQALGPRPAGSTAALSAAALLEQELRRMGWNVEAQEFERDGITLRNVIARAGPDGDPLLVGTHYDTRALADRDPDEARRVEPAPGANGSSSGVAVLLELATTLDLGLLTRPVVLAFFDGGDQAGLDGWPPAVGATEATKALGPSAMILVDTVGAENQRFLLDPNSDPRLSEQLWMLASRLGYDQWFISEAGPAVVGGHQPFKDQGIPVAAIAGADYAYRHTMADTVDQVDVASLERVGRVLEAYLRSRVMPR